jgi:hypothetical protein
MMTCIRRHLTSSHATNMFASLDFTSGFLAVPEASANPLLHQFHHSMSLDASTSSAPIDFNLLNFFGAMSPPQQHFATGGMAPIMETPDSHAAAEQPSASMPTPPPSATKPQQRPNLNRMNSTPSNPTTYSGIFSQPPATFSPTPTSPEQSALNPWLLSAYPAMSLPSAASVPDLTHFISLASTSKVEQPQPTNIPSSQSGVATNSASMQFSTDTAMASPQPQQSSAHHADDHYSGDGSADEPKCTCSYGLEKRGGGFIHMNILKSIVKHR